MAIGIVNNSYGNAAGSFQAAYKGKNVALCCLIHAVDTDVLAALQQSGYTVTLPITSAISLMQQRIAERGVGLCLTTTSL